MRQLIISDYDMECEFTWVVIDDGKEIERGDDSKGLKKYNLYDEEYNWWNEKFIDFDKNPPIQDFDTIIVCVDGTITIYNKGEKKNDTI